jgi:hypothetical protein
MATPNPPWSRDELIVTLDFYLRHTPSIPANKSSEISELSDFLNLLQSKMGGGSPKQVPKQQRGAYETDELSSV